MLIKVVPLFVSEGDEVGEEIVKDGLDPAAVVMVQAEVRRLAWNPEPGTIRVEKVRTVVVHLASGHAYEILDENRDLVDRIKAAQEE